MTRLGRLGSTTSAMETPDPGTEMEDSSGSLTRECPFTVEVSAKDYQRVARWARRISDGEFALALPIPVSRNANQHNGCAPEGLAGPGDDRVQRPGSADQNVDRGKPRVSGAAIGAGNVGFFPAQDEQADDGQRVGEHHAEDDVGVKLVVASAHGERRS